MKKIIVYAFALFVLMIVASSCTSTSKAGGTKKTPTKSLTFNGSIKDLLFEKCVNCHTGGRKGNFELYADVKAKITNGEFAHAVFEEMSMPPNKPLSESELAMLKKWVDAGAPEN